MSYGRAAGASLLAEDTPPPPLLRWAVRSSPRRCPASLMAAAPPTPGLPGLWLEGGGGGGSSSSVLCGGVHAAPRCTTAVTRRQSTHVAAGDL